jgi:hypothetical protein
MMIKESLFDNDSKSSGTFETRSIKGVASAKKYVMPLRMIELWATVSMGHFLPRAQELSPLLRKYRLTSSRHLFFI